MAVIEVNSEKPPALVKLYEVKSIEGSASITVRKQKLIFLFEFVIEMYFKAEHATDKETSCMGTIKVHEFNQDDDDIDIDVTCEKQMDFITEVKKVLSSG